MRERATIPCCSCLHCSWCAAAGRARGKMLACFRLVIKQREPSAHWKLYIFHVSWGHQVSTGPSNLCAVFPPPHQESQTPPTGVTGPSLVGLHSWRGKREGMSWFVGVLVERQRDHVAPLSYSSGFQPGDDFAQPPAPNAPGYIWQGLWAFLVVTTGGGGGCDWYLSGQRPGTLLNILQYKGQPPTTKKFPAHNVSKPEAEKPWVRGIRISICLVKNQHWEKDWQGKVCGGTHQSPFNRQFQLEPLYGMELLGPCQQVT